MSGRVNNSILSYLRIAGQVAMRGSARDYFLGALGVRADGAIVASFNGPAPHPAPSAHAEARLSRKLDTGSVVYVARVLSSGDFANSRPCRHCMKALRHKKCRVVYYTTGPAEFEKVKFC